jgi:transposase
MKKRISTTTVMNTAAVSVDVNGAPPQPVTDGASASATPRYHAVVGLDVGDRQSHYCVLDLAGTVVAEGTVATKEAALRVVFEGKGRMRIALEAGTHSPWISRLLVALGHEVLVANPRKLRLIAESDAKHDRADAQLLARLAHVGPTLLSPIHVRSAQTQIDLALIRAREVAVQTRTKIVNAVRGMVKSTGHRLPASPTLTFAQKATEACPEALRPALRPLIRLVQTLTDDIAAYDRLVIEQARTYPETQAIQSIPGVGALTAVAFVLVLNNDRTRFTRSRDVGCYLGFKPKQRDSGMRSPQLGITKAGDPLIRHLATQSAHYILGPFGRDSALRRWGLSLASRGGKNAKKRAVVAVARKLVVLMHRLWITQETYDPMRGVRVASVA